MVVFTSYNAPFTLIELSNNCMSVILSNRCSTFVILPNRLMTSISACYQWQGTYSCFLISLHKKRTPHTVSQHSHFSTSHHHPFHDLNVLLKSDFRFKTDWFSIELLISITWTCSCLSLCSLEAGSSSKSVSNFTSECPWLFPLRSSSSRCEGFDLRAAARAAYPSPVTLHPDNLVGEELIAVKYYFHLIHLPCLSAHISS